MGNNRSNLKERLSYQLKDRDWSFEECWLTKDCGVKMVTIKTLSEQQELGRQFKAQFSDVLIGTVFEKESITLFLMDH